jgi:hypothetical protein
LNIFFKVLRNCFHTEITACQQAKTDVAVWGMDRLTFHNLLMGTTQRKRKAYEGFLANVPLLCKFCAFFLNLRGIFNLVGISIVGQL